MAGFASFRDQNLGQGDSVMPISSRKSMLRHWLQVGIGLGSCRRGGVSALHRNLRGNYVAKQISQDRPNPLAGAGEQAGIELLGPQTPDRAGSGCENLRGPERPPGEGSPGWPAIPGDR